MRNYRRRSELRADCTLRPAPLARPAAGEQTGAGERIYPVMRPACALAARAARAAPAAHRRVAFCSQLPSFWDV